MSRIDSRIGRLEQTLAPGKCRVCLGRGKASVPVVDGDAPSGVHGCSSCGAVAADVRVIRLPDGDDDDGSASKA